MRHEYNPEVLTWFHYLCIGATALVLLATIWMLMAIEPDPIYGQSSQTMSHDLSVAKWNVQVCIQDANYLHRKGLLPRPNPERLRKHCIQQALAKYREQVETEETLIEGMTRSCCPNIRQAPNQRSPYYRDPKGYQSVELERMMVALEDGLSR